MGWLTMGDDENEQWIEMEGIELKWFRRPPFWSVPVEARYLYRCYIARYLPT